MRFVGIGWLVLLFVSSTSLSLSATPKHGCAPSTPRAVSGTLIPLPAQFGLLFINEVLLVPHSTWNCSEPGAYTPTNDAWVEIYNPQSQPFDLYSVHTSLDSGPNTNAFYFPFGSAIAAHGYLVVFPRTSAAFLATEGTTLRLVIHDVILDQITLPPLAEDQSYARIPDGSRTWQITSKPTIAASNTPAPLSTPTPTLTHIRHHKNRDGNRSGSSTGSSTDAASRTDYQTPVDGTQPDWRALQLPPSTSSTPTVLPSTGVAATLPQIRDDMDLPRKIVLTVVLVALIISMLWCWRLFSTS